MSIFLTILTLATAVYVLAILMFGFGLVRLRRAPHVPASTRLSASVIMPARNESDVLARTIESIMEQDFCGDWEVIVVDDRSTDETPLVLQQLSLRFPRLRVITVTEKHPKSPKKNALALGIKASSHDIIVTTDADCVYDPAWLRTMLAHFDESVGVVAGLTVFDLPAHAHKPIWQKIQWLDFFVQNFLAAAAVGLKMPASCNGSNLAYRRSVYNQIEGFGRSGHVVSGDDVLFAQRVALLTNWQMKFAIEPSTTVRSLPVQNLRELAHQRLRWASKGLSYRGAMLVFLFAIYAFYLSLVVAAALPFFVSGYWPWAGGILLAKTAADLLVVSYAAQRFQQQQLLPYFLPFTLAHTLITPLIGLGGLLIPFRWKGDWYRTSRLPRVIRRRVAVIKKRFSLSNSAAHQR